MCRPHELRTLCLRDVPPAYVSVCGNACNTYCSFGDIELNYVVTSDLCYCGGVQFPKLFVIRRLCW